MQSKEDGFQPSREVKPYLILLAISIGVFMYGLDLAIPNIALPILTQAFHVSFSAAQWIIFSYLLASNSLVLIIGNLSDLADKKKLYLAGFVLFIISSGLCSISPSILSLIVCRFFQGLGGIILAGIAPAIITEVCPKKKLGHYLGILTTVFAIGALMGPGIGGLIINTLGWRSAFVINIPIGLLGGIIFYIVTPSLKSYARNQKFQFLGALFITLTLTFLTLAMTMFESQGFSNTVKFLFVFSFLCAVSFLLEEFLSESSLIDSKLLQSFQVNLGIPLGILIITACICIGTILPFFLSYAKHYPAYIIGAILMIHSASQGASSFIGGIFCDYVQPRLVGLVGVFTILLGLHAYSQLNMHSTLLTVSLTAIPCGVGQGAFDVSNSKAVMSHVSSALLGTASSLLALTRTLGYLLGFSFLGFCFATRTVSTAQALAQANFADLPAESICLGYQFTFQVASYIIAIGVCLAAYLLWLEHKSLTS